MFIELSKHIERLVRVLPRLRVVFYYLFAVLSAASRKKYNSPLLFAYINAVYLIVSYRRNQFLPLTYKYISS